MKVYSAMIFLTVGTQFGFDRLVKAVDEALESGTLSEPVFAQVGPGNYVPRHMDYTEALEKQAFEEMLDSCEGIISHAGIGTITLAMKCQKPLLVMPRMSRYGEVVNDHQVATAHKFEQSGHVLAAYQEYELPDKIRQLKTFVPEPRVPGSQGVIDRICQFLESC